LSRPGIGFPVGAAVAKVANHSLPSFPRSSVGTNRIERCADTQAPLQRGGLTWRARLRTAPASMPPPPTLERLPCVPTVDRGNEGGSSQPLLPAHVSVN
jgi:hypothetical protein